MSLMLNGVWSWQLACAPELVQIVANLPLPHDSLAASCFEAQRNSIQRYTLL
jgi:hypothetical protein